MKKYSMLLSVIMLSVLLSCKKKEYFFYSSLDKKHWVTRCDYGDTTYFAYGKTESLGDLRSQVYVKNYSLLAGWHCMIRWNGDTAVIVQDYLDFVNRGGNKKLIIKGIGPEEFNEVYNGVQWGVVRIEKL